MKMMPVKFYYARAMVFAYLIGFGILAYLVVEFLKAF